MITIKEMANMLGISSTTVSNVIHGKTGEVSKDTVEKVQKMIVEYDYVPNINARNLAQNKSKIIGFAMKSRKDKPNNSIKDPFVGELLGAVENSVRAKGYFMMVYISDVISEIISSVATWNVDGLILLGMQGDDFIMLKKRFNKPMVFVDSYFDKEVMDYMNVGLEDRRGTYEITKYLISNGHKKIAFLSDNCINGDYERFLGYRAAIKEAGISYREEDFIMIRPGENEIASCLAEIYQYQQEYTAFCCTSDYYAVMIMNYLKDRGKRIPEDISIVGFDDNTYSKIVRPALTTVHQDVSVKGDMAVERLFAMLEGEEIEDSKLELPVELVIRDTVKRIK